MKTCASIFSGGKAADIGLMAAGYTPLWGVECDPAIAEIADANVPARTIRKRAQDVRYRSLERPDLLWASPECKEFSAANTNGIEGPEQISQAKAVCSALRQLRPRAFVLENVTFYRTSQSFALIRATLDSLGYWSSAVLLNAADYGVPQTRKRLILRAVLGGEPSALPEPTPWRGWHQAIADLIPTLPDTEFAPWQLARLPAALAESAYFAANDSRNQRNESYGKSSHRLAGDPAFTVSHNTPGWWKAFLVSAGGTPRRKQIAIRDEDEPSMTVATNADGRVRAFIVDDQNGARGAAEDRRGLTNRQASEPTYTVQSRSNKPGRAWLDEGRVVGMTARALARFQTIPDSYQLPDIKVLAARIIGNGVPCLLAEAIGRSLLEVL